MSGVRILLWHLVALTGMLAGIALVIAVAAETGTFNGLSLIGVLVLIASAIWDGFILHDAHRHALHLAERNARDIRDR